MKRTYTPRAVLPRSVGDALAPSRYWFLIGGHAVRCFAPYRPTEDVDFGVANARNARALLELLSSKGKVEVRERSSDTIHLTFARIDVSIFVLPKLAEHTDGGTLTLDGILATKFHAILDRGTRRDFFDLYVMLEHHRVGLVEGLRALREVYRTEINDGLVLRALTYFEDAEAEAALPGEGSTDWRMVKDFFVRAVGALLLPPPSPLAIQSRTVDVQSSTRSEQVAKKPRRTGAAPKRTLRKR